MTVWRGDLDRCIGPLHRSGSDVGMCLSPFREASTPSEQLGRVTPDKNATLPTLASFSFHRGTHDVPRPRTSRISSSTDALTITRPVPHASKCTWRYHPLHRQRRRRVSRTGIWRCLHRRRARRSLSGRGHRTGTCRVQPIGASMLVSWWDGGLAGWRDGWLAGWLVGGMAGWRDGESISRWAREPRASRLD